MDVDILSINKDNSMKEKTEQLYCICRSNVSNVFMIMCDNCEEWYHGDCVGITAALANEIDTYTCSRCKKKNPKLKTTYKMEECKNKKQKSKRKRTAAKQKFEYWMEVDASSNDSNISFENKSNATVKCNASSFEFVDTTIRKAKTEAYERFKEASPIIPNKISREEKKSRKSKELRQCYGPGCTNASRTGSKYCSDQCGQALAKNRILEILPQRIHQWNSIPSAADEMSHNKLMDIRRQLQEIQQQIEGVDIRIIGLIDNIIKAKKPNNNFEEIVSDDVSSVDCILCGAEVQNKTVEKHMEQCYNKIERKVFITEYTEKPDDMQWNVFCNQKISKNVYCKKMRVLCPMHYKDFRKDNEVCGYPVDDKGSKVFCGNIGRNCNHVNWEEIRRAELDLEKLNLLMKFQKLKKEEMEIRCEMASRGDMLNLMLHQTIVH